MRIGRYLCNWIVTHGSRVLGFLWMVGLIAVVFGSLGPAPKLMNDMGKDKLIHLFAYGMLSFLFTLAHLTHRNPTGFSPKKVIVRLSLIAFCFSLLGGVIELLQGLTGRQPDIWDGVANTVGSTLGVLVGWMGFYLITIYKKSDGHL